MHVLGGGRDDCFPFLGPCPRWALARAVGIALAPPQASSSSEVTSMWRSYNGRRRGAMKVLFTGGDAPSRHHRAFLQS